MSFGSRLREARTMHGWTMKELSERCGITPPSLVRYERHDYMPMLGTIITLAHALEMPVAFFVQDYDCETERETQNEHSRETDGGGRL